jgi:hypothetical protein
MSSVSNELMPGNFPVNQLGSDPTVQRSQKDSAGQHRASSKDGENE